LQDVKNNMKNMKKSQKWLLLSMVIIPAIILAVPFIIDNDMSIKEFPWWAIIIPVLILVSPFTFILAQRSGQAMYDAHLQKQKKRFLTAFGIYIIFLIIILIILYFYSYQFFLPFLLIQTAFLLSVFFMRIRLFFPKKQESTEADNQNYNHG